jgi:hypothetical protein
VPARRCSGRPARSTDHMVFYRPRDDQPPRPGDPGDPVAAPQAPGVFPLQLGLEATDVTATSARLTWSGLVPDANLIFLFRANPDGTIFPYLLPALPSTIVDQGLSSSTFYFYLARQFTLDAVGPWSFPVPVLTAWQQTHSNPVLVPLRRARVQPVRGRVRYPRRLSQGVRKLQA